MPLHCKLMGEEMSIPLGEFCFLIYLVVEWYCLPLQIINLLENLIRIMTVSHDFQRCLRPYQEEGQQVNELFQWFY